MNVNLLFLLIICVFSGCVSRKYHIDTVENLNEEIKIARFRCEEIESQKLQFYLRNYGR